MQQKTTTAGSSEGISLEALEGRTLMSVTVAPSGHDDTTAILAAANNAGSGGVVAFQAGNYQLSGTLNLPADRSYQGNGAVLNGNNSSGLSLNGGSHTEITGFTFNGTTLNLNGAGGVNVHGDRFTNITSGAAISSSSVHDSFIDNNDFTSVNAGTGIYGWVGNNNQFDHNTFDYVFEPIHIFAGNGNQNVDVSYNQITHATRIGIEIQEPFNNLKVDNNDISQWLPHLDSQGHDSHMALSIATGGWSANNPDNPTPGVYYPSGRNQDISGNVLIQDGPAASNSTWAKFAIEIMGGNVAVHNNYISGWGGGLLLGNDGTVTSQNNTFVGNNDYGDYVEGDSTAWANPPIVKLGGDQHFSSSASNIPAPPSVASVVGASGSTSSGSTSTRSSSSGSTQTPAPVVGSTVPSPTALTATSPASNEIDLTWKDLSNRTATYQLERRATHGTADFAVIATLSAGTTSYKDITNVNATWEYDYRLTAIVGKTASAPVTAHVQALPPVTDPIVVQGGTSGSTSSTGTTSGGTKTSTGGTSSKSSGSTSTSSGSTTTKTSSATPEQDNGPTVPPSVGNGAPSSTTAKTPRQKPVKSTTQKTGLRQVIFMNSKLSGRHVTSTASSLNVAWGTNAPIAGASASNYSARWKGHMTAPATGSYTLTVNADSSVRLYVDHHLVLDHWSAGKSGGSVTIQLKAGEHAIRLDYKHASGSASHVSLAWSSPTQPQQIIPQQSLLAA